MRVALILLILAVGSTFGSPRTAAAETALGTSTWSLELGTTLGGYDDNIAGFAIRRHSGSSAFRFRVELGLNESDQDGAYNRTGIPSATATEAQTYNSHAFSIQWMRFAEIRENVTATLAVGPVMEHYRSTWRRGENYGLPAFYENENAQRTTSYGADLSLGVEWFFNPRFSLGGQSGIRATAGTRKTVDVLRQGTGATLTIVERNVEGDVRQVTTTSTRILLTGYF